MAPEVRQTADERPLARRPLVSGEANVLFDSILFRLEQLEWRVSDHEQRFDTLQTPWWKRLIFWIDGWPTTDLNAEAPAWRPWRRWWRS